ncbi:Subtilisin-like protease SBT4.11 [Glycine soja]|uniref:Subtilisin-like protease SBT4.11 n=1 Tax=Glycine soja TaxID=3848 RepID=A0A445LZP4_GLYSO|nr:Subtilisin-like protease SBT4.11 [Glycine soja]
MSSLKYLTLEFGQNLRASMTKDSVHHLVKGRAPTKLLKISHAIDILAAFDDAIADGVDIITVSLGGFNDENFFRDVIAIGAFHAMKNGVLTVISAGNDGPRSSSLSNFSPWSITVAASTIYDYICIFKCIQTTHLS